MTVLCWKKVARHCVNAVELTNYRPRPVPQMNTVLAGRTVMMAKAV